MATSAADMSARILKAAKAIESAQRDAVTAAGVVMKSYLLDAAEQHAGTDRRMRNVGTKGAALGAGFDVKGTTKPVALMKARGPWALREKDVPAHSIGPRRRGGKLAVSIGEDAYARVHHPGTKGVSRWAPARERGHPATVAVLKKKNIDAIGKVFG